MTAPQRAALEAALPGRFRFFEARDDADYIYSVESFATLSGKKLHGKRNFCNRFETAHDWRYEALSPAGFDDCRSLLQSWDAEKNGGNAEENEAIERMFQYWDGLGMTGGILYADRQRSPPGNGSAATRSTSILKKRPTIFPARIR